jgi:non-specific serine/threonine protein kinase
MPAEGRPQRRLEVEIDNVRAALGWSLRANPALALRLAGFLHPLWSVPGRYDEGLGWIDATITAAGDRAPVGDRARALRTQVHLLEFKGSNYDWEGLNEIARARAAEAVSLARQAQDPAGIAEGLIALSRLEWSDELPQPRRHALAEEAVTHARAAGDERLAAAALVQRALALHVADAATEIEEAVAALQRIGDTRELVWLRMNVGFNLVKDRDPIQARPWLQEALVLAREVGDPIQQAFVLGNVGNEALLAGDLDRAVAAYAEQLLLCRAHPFWASAETLAGLAAIAAERGDPERAARLLGAAGTAGPWDADPDMRVEFERRLAPARRRLGDRDWDAAERAGAQLSYQEAVDFAVGRAAAAERSP